MGAKSHMLDVGRVLDAAKYAAPEGETYDLSVVRQHANRFVRELRKLRRITTSGERKRERARVYAILHSYSAKYCGVLLQAKPRTLPPAEAHTLAKGLDCWGGLGEAVKVYPKTKSSGGERPICVFGPKRRAGQALALEVLKALHGPSEFDFAAKGRGRDAACRRWLDDVKGGGRWYVIADVKNFFGSVRTDNLHRTLRLPRSVVRHCLTIPEAPIQPACSPSLETAARAGIPQGSLASPFVAALMIQMVLKDIAAACRISYCDDILLRVASNLDAEAISDALGQALLSHPHGPLQLKSLEVSRIGKPNDFLGMKIRRNAHWDPERFRAIPSQTAFGRMQARMKDRLLAHQMTSLEEAYAYAKSWGNSFGEWKRTRNGDNLLFTTSSDIWDDCKAAVYRKIFKAK